MNACENTPLQTIGDEQVHLQRLSIKGKLQIMFGFLRRLYVLFHKTSLY